MRIQPTIIVLIIISGLLTIGIRITFQPSLPHTGIMPVGNPLANLLNPDGTLRLDGTFSGVLDVSGWQINLDPRRGPLFQPQASAPQWRNLGSAPEGALNGRSPLSQ